MPLPTRKAWHTVQLLLAQHFLFTLRALPLPHGASYLATFTAPDGLHSFTGNAYNPSEAIRLAHAQVLLSREP